MRVESAVMPEYKEFLRGQIFVNFNVETEVTEDGTKYVYEQLRFNPPMSDEALDKEVAKHKEAIKPKVITMAQCREQLILLGLDDEVEAMLESIPDLITKKRYKSTWEYETIVKIDNAMLLELAPLLGIDIDKFFIDASKL